MQIFGDNLHEISKPVFWDMQTVFWEKIRKIINLSSAGFAQHVVKVKKTYLKSL